MVSAQETCSDMVQSDTMACWQRWFDRWNRFQQSYVPRREEQFDLMVDYSTRWWRGKPIRALDLACGPGCIAEHLLRRLPGTEVVGLDLDPWLIEMGRQMVGSPAGMTWVEADLRDAGWIGKLPHQAFNTVFSATALHWFDAVQLRQIYRNVATILVKDGLFFNADVLPTGTRLIRRLSRDMLIRWQNREIATLQGESWQSFWKDASRESAFGHLLEERDQKLGLRKPRVFLPVESHQETLLSVGFREVGEIWRCHESAILLAIR